jgi:C1A family cysteine protease
MADLFVPAGLGWLRDLPDPRDYTREHRSIRSQLDELKAAPSMAESVDLREFCTEPSDQGLLASSSAHACLGLLGYFERRALGATNEPSRLFVYHTTRRLVGAPGDAGAGLRITLKAMARFGIPPERTWPYDPGLLDVSPEAYTFSFDREFRKVAYFRLDRSNGSEGLLRTVKSFLAAGFPSVFGFSVFTSLTADGDIPFPTRQAAIRGGQAAVAVGYDDRRRIGSEKGALLVRCSWGRAWGEGGYGWLPYAYVRERLAVDFWTLTKREWLRSGEFDCPP